MPIVIMLCCRGFGFEELVEIANVGKAFLRHVLLYLQDEEFGGHLRMQVKRTTEWHEMICNE